ncbi:hypothetical protein GGH94_004109 [Coemansia aciculifera]|uniref:Fanconi-associated nuclease n=1 Tax=Coemansia aciculifera TaxID=417176 RepID=A0A9W8M4E6_9FUNG|nr:hypothetical protein GGH94_004109 [Coemansia aciculifera]
MLRSSTQKKLYDETIVLSDSSSDSDVAEVTSVFAISASLPLPTTRTAEAVVVVLGDSETESPIEISRIRRQRPILPRSTSLRSPGPAASVPSRRSVEQVQERSSILPLALSTEVEFSGICSPPPSQQQLNDTAPATPLVAPLDTTDHGPASPDADDKQKERLLYLHIFDNVLQTVLSGESHLFSDQEQETLRAFMALERHSRYLYTRLFMRKHGWIRVSALNAYGEDVVVEQSCKCLGTRTSSHEPFVQSEAEITDGEEALQLLTLPELKALAKARGIKQLTNKPKEAICAAILKGAKQRTVISFFRKASDGGSEDSTKQRLGTLVREVTKLTGPLVRLSPPTAELFERLHLVFFRTPTFRGDDNPMKVAVLATIGQICFPKYNVVRSHDLFASRDDVIQYKALLEVGSQMGELGAALVKETEKHRLGWEMFLEYRDMWERHIESLCEKTGAHSRSLTYSGNGDEVVAIEYWKRRFTPGSALAQIVERGAKFAANLKQFEDEECVLQSLLAQTAYRLGKRGVWYERLILLHSAHLRPKRVKSSKGDDKQTASALLRQALLTARDICIRALNDQHVGRLSLHSISRQMRALEAKLAFEEDQLYQHSRISLEWKPAPERTVYGVRINDRNRRGPSLWDGNDEVPCSVERLALWRYQSLGYSGLHSENSMVTSLFSLLFWDVIFYPLPGALDTEYQSRPLDMGNESFYFSRQTLIDQRLKEIVDGEFADIILANYDFGYGAECVGVSWDITCDQLLIVAKYIGGHGLAAICKVLAREYRSKSSGFPDLCLWNSVTENVMFVEVKGPKDKLSDSQRDWVDILLSNGISVEVCLVREGDARDHE